jgi:hypothetical protein
MGDVTRHKVLPLDDRFSERLNVILHLGDGSELTGMDTLRMATKMD